jgi:hypothetical protein
MEEEREHTTAYPHADQDSNILKREIEGIHNMIFSDDHDDILNTVRILNESYMHSTQNFYKLLKSEFQPQSVLSLVTDPVEMVQKAYKVISNYASAKLMNDNFYAFSYNQTLLDINIESLKSLGDKRIKYI